MKTKSIWQQSFLVGFGLGAALLISVPRLAAQSGNHPSSAKSSGPPAEWLEMLDATYEDSENRVPPGYPPYSSLKPFRSFASNVVTPLLQPWAAARKAETDFDVEDVGRICRPTGILMAHQNRGFQLVVSPGRITSIGLDVTRAIRRIYLNRDHLANPPLTSWGDSVAHWEAGTNSLVVDTVGFDDKSFLDLEGGRHSTELHVVEKWKFVADGKWLEKTWVVEDPRALKSSYTFVRYHQKLPATNSGSGAV